MEELGNLIEEETEDLLIIDSKTMADPSAAEAVKKAQKIGQQQFQKFTKECLVEKNKAHYWHNPPHSVETVCWLNDKDGK